MDNPAPIKPVAPASESAGEKIRRYLDSHEAHWLRIMGDRMEDKGHAKRSGSRQRRIQSLLQEIAELKEEVKELKRFLVELGSAN